MTADVAIERTRLAAPERPQGGADGQVRDRGVLLSGTAEHDGVVNRRQELIEERRLSDTGRSAEHHQPGRATASRVPRANQLAEVGGSPDESHAISLAQG